jgi:restriction endonuclease S subunit
MKRKDSKISWAGEIPEKWDIVPFKSFLKKKKEILEHWENENVLSLTMNGVIIRDLENPTGKMPATFDGYQKINKDNLILCLFDIDVTPRCVGVAQDDGVTSPAYSQYEVKYGIIQYYYYLLLMLDNDKILLPYSKTLRSTLTDEYFGAIKVPITTNIVEQQKIADFLDSKTALIDEIITDTKCSIEELKAYKQSLITEGVTKGLAPNVPMKDSGVEWIGEVASTVKIIKLKFLLDSALTYGANETGIEYSEQLPRYIRITDIDLDGKLKTTGKLSLSDEVAEPYLLEEGDLLFARSGATVGKTFVYHDCYDKSAYAGYLIKASLNKKKILPEYLYYYTQSSLYESWKNQIFIQSTIQNIGADKYNVLPVVLQGSIEIQEQIVIFLDEKTKNIDELILSKKTLISDYETYKKSLIYEYVTGKKQVI